VEYQLLNFSRLTFLSVAVLQALCVRSLGDEHMLMMLGSINIVTLSKNQSEPWVADFLSAVTGNRKLTGYEPTPATLMPFHANHGSMLPMIPSINYRSDFSTI